MVPDHLCSAHIKGRIYLRDYREMGPNTAYTYSLARDWIGALLDTNAKLTIHVILYEYVYMHT